MAKEFKKCKIEDCENKFYGRGYCSKHWQRFRKYNDATHYTPPNKANFRHGQCSTPEYIVWANMKARCYNSNHSRYKDYGGRGVKVCKKWQSFTGFLDDMGKKPSPRHTIDRVDNDGNYEPKNCRWASYKEQANNKSDNVLITHEGSTHNIMQWSEITGINFHTLYYRLKVAGWSESRALTDFRRM